MNAALPINPTIIRIMRVLRIARGRWPLCALSRVYLGCRQAPDLVGWATDRLHPQQMPWDVCSQRGTLVCSQKAKGVVYRVPGLLGQLGPADLCLPALVLKLLKMATGMRALLDTVVQALPQVGWGPAPLKATISLQGTDFREDLAHVPCLLACSVLRPGSCPTVWLS